jgi:hypothetical protein
VPKDTHSTLPADHELVLPEQVTIALAELAGAAREGLLALAVGTGLGVLGELLAADVDRLVGPKGRHNPDRTAVRHGSQPGQVSLGGRRVRVDRPRVRSTDGTREVPVPTWEAFASIEVLGQLAVERMLARLSTRRYPAGLEPVGTAVERTASGPRAPRPSRRSPVGSWPRPTGIGSASPCQLGVCEVSKTCPPPAAGSNGSRSAGWWRCRRSAASHRGRRARPVHRGPARVGGEWGRCRAGPRGPPARSQPPAEFGPAPTSPTR